MRLKLILLYISLSIGLYTPAQKLKLGDLFNEGVVLQRNTKVAIWGTSSPKNEVSICIQGKKHKTTSDASGNWTVHIASLKEGGPYTLTSYCLTDSIKLNEVYVGDVWIAGGQSNMAWPLSRSDNGAEEITNATNKNIHFMLVPTIAYEGDEASGDINWRTATTENVASMSGVAYFYAKELQKKLNVPIGIICCYKGGTAAEVWMSRETLLKNSCLSPIVTDYDKYMQTMGINKYSEIYSTYQKQIKQYKDSIKAGFRNAIWRDEPMGDKHYKRPYGLYNTMLKRIIPFSIKGVIWYQGEGNTPRAEQYRTLFPALIDEWRTDFQNRKLPVFFVQLSAYDQKSFKGKPFWAELREAQLLTWQKVKYTGMAVSMDVGNQHNIHPTDKKTVGERIAAIAFNQVYGMDIPYSGPVYKSAKFNKNSANISFNFIYTGLFAKKELKGFTICGKDKQFVPARAIIRSNQVIVSADGIDHPIAVRYNWANWADGNLKNNVGFPASPFRTDNFPLLSKGILSADYRVGY